MPRFIHAADIHLDSPLRNLELRYDAPVETIRGATRQAFENLTRTAIDQRVDFVVIAGDLYDGDWRDQQTGLFFARQVQKLVEAGISLFVIRGNHDAASVITKSITLPKNPDGSEVLIGTTQPERRRLDHLGATIHGQSFGKRSEVENLAAHYPLADSDTFNIGVLHTSLAGAEGHDTYSPCTPAQLQEKGYQYWALGHIHQRGEHQAPGDAPIVFSGNIQGRHIRESGPKGCLLIDYTGREITQSTFVPLDVVRWELCDLDISEVESNSDLMDAFQDWLSEKLTELDDQLLVTRVVFSGRGSLHDTLHADISQLEADIRARCIEVAGDGVWLEDIRVRTSEPQIDTPSGIEGPLECVRDVFEDMLNTSESSDLVQSDVIALQKKLGRKISTEDQAQMIREARAGLMARLRGQHD